MNVIQQKADPLAKICAQYGVQEMYAFGSVLIEDEFTSDSDIDLAVVFNRQQIKGSFDQYMEFKAALENLFGRPVDLVSLKQARNKVFLRELHRTKRQVYAA